MIVRMLRHIGGFRSGAEWPPAGGTLEVDDHEGAHLIRAGHAVQVDDPTADETDPAGTLDLAAEAAAVIDRKIAEVMAWVGDYPARARAVLEVERARPRPRARLIARLEPIVDSTDEGESARETETDNAGEPADPATGSDGSPAGDEGSSPAGEPDGAAVGDADEPGAATSSGPGDQADADEPF